MGQHTTPRKVMTFPEPTANLFNSVKEHCSKNLRFRMNNNQILEMLCQSWWLGTIREEADMADFEENGKNSLAIKRLKLTSDYESQRNPVLRGKTLAQFLDELKHPARRKETPTGKKIKAQSWVRTPDWGTCAITQFCAFGAQT